MTAQIISMRPHIKNPLLDERIRNAQSMRVCLGPVTVDMVHVIGLSEAINRVIPNGIDEPH